MSDDLVKRLRDDHPDYLTSEAADRIEELEAKLFACATDLHIYMNAHAASETKLGKAVDVLKMVDQAIMENATDQDLLMWGEPTVSHIRTTLAELEGHGE